MLIEVAYKKDDIVVFKTVAGDEVIAKLAEIKPNGDLVVKKPLTMQLMMGPSGQGGVAMLPYMLGADENSNFVFKSEQIISPTKAKQDAAAGYIQNTTGLAIPTANTPKDLKNIRG